MAVYYFSSLVAVARLLFGYRIAKGTFPTDVLKRVSTTFKLSQCSRELLRVKSQS